MEAWRTIAGPCIEFITRFINVLELHVKSHSYGACIGEAKWLTKNRFPLTV